jgi:hypothetical protein
MCAVVIVSLARILKTTVFLERGGDEKSWQTCTRAFIIDVI